MNTIPCITDSDEFRYEPDGPEDTDPRTDAEKRINWMCSEWQEALTINDYEAWATIRYMAFGAKQALIYCSNRREDYKLFDDIGDMAFTNSMDCLRKGKYEGAKK